jgi:hypothetical protein
LKWHITDVTSSIFSAAFLASSIVKSFNKNLAITLLNQSIREATKNTEKKGRVDACYLELRMNSPVQRMAIRIDMAFRKRLFNRVESLSVSTLWVRNFGRKGVPIRRQVARGKDFPVK